MLTWLKGIIPPLVTPYDEQGRIDTQALRDEIEFLIGCGASGLCVGGSTGEGAGLKPEELFELCSVCVEQSRDRVPVIGGAIPDTTDEAIVLGLAAKSAGCCALQITPPHYLFQPDNTELTSYYSCIREKTELPIILYNVMPWALVGVDGVGCLVKAGAIEGVKQSGSSLHLLADLLLQFGDVLPILSAVDDLLYPSFVLGSPGSISMIVTVMPKEAVGLYRAVQAGDSRRALELHKKLLIVLRALEGWQGLHARVKAAITLQGRAVGNPRHPFSPASDEDKLRVRRALEEAGVHLANQATARQART